MTSTLDHGARAHSTWSASATARNVHCPGALALSANAPEQPESIHAARGTACHQLAEKCLRGGTDEVFAFVGEVETTKEHEITIDEEIAASAAAYVDYVREHALHGELMIEQRFSLGILQPPFDAGGTADAVIYYRQSKTIEVVDLKNGTGLVEATDNPQLRTYAIGALLANPQFDVERVIVTIVQPRAPHKDGRIRSDAFHVIDLLEWTNDLLAAMHRSKQAFVERADIVGELSEDAWAERWLNPGRCKWCPAEGFCPALRRRAHDVVGLWFEGDAPKIRNLPGNDTPEAVARDLDALDLVEDWIKARRAYAHQLAQNGTDVPGYQLVEKHGNRKWAADEAIVAKDLRLLGLGDDDIFAQPAVRSPVQIEKVLGAKRKNEIAVMWHKPVTGTNLVRSDKTSKPPAQNVAQRYFE